MFEGLAWLTYDLAFRRQAAATNNRNWSHLNPTLYNVCVAGKARKSTRCKHCLSLKHTTAKCVHMLDPDPELGTRVKAIKMAVLVLSRYPIPRGRGNGNYHPPGRALGGQPTSNGPITGNYRYQAPGSFLNRYPLNGSQQHIYNSRPPPRRLPPICRLWNDKRC